MSKCEESVVVMVPQGAGYECRYVECGEMGPFGEPVLCKHCRPSGTDLHKHSKALREGIAWTDEDLD